MRPSSQNHASNQDGNYRFNPESCLRYRRHLLLSLLSVTVLSINLSSTGFTDGPETSFHQDQSDSNIDSVRHLSARNPRGRGTPKKTKSKKTKMMKDKTSNTESRKDERNNKRIYTRNPNHLPKPKPQTEQNTLIITLAMGKQATHSPLLSRLHRSLRVAGNFRGYFAVLTDAAPDVIYSSPLFLHDDEKFVILPIKEEDKVRNRDIHPELGMKYFKTLIWEYVLDHRILGKTVEYATYLDLDIVVGMELTPYFEELSERRLLQHREQIEKLLRQQQQEQQMQQFKQQQNHQVNQSLEVSAANPISTIYFFGKQGVHYHGGIFTTSPYSTHCLSLWAREIIQNNLPRYHRSTSDQMAIARVGKRIDAGLETGCELIALDWGKYVIFPDRGIMETGVVFPFIHVTNTYRSKVLEGSLQEEYFESVLGVSEEEKRKWREARRRRKEEGEKGEDVDYNDYDCDDWMFVSKMVSVTKSDMMGVATK